MEFSIRFTFLLLLLITSSRTVCDAANSESVKKGGSVDTTCTGSEKCCFIEKDFDTVSSADGAKSSDGDKTCYTLKTKLTDCLASKCTVDCDDNCKLKLKDASSGGGGGGGGGGGKDDKDKDKKDKEDDSDFSRKSPASKSECQRQLVADQCTNCNNRRRVRVCSRRVARNKCFLSQSDRQRVIRRAIRQCGIKP